MLPDVQIDRRIVRRLRTKYLILTLALFLPLLWAFVRVRNLYPIASWNVMVRSSPVQEPFSYYILRGETDSGELVELPAAGWSNPLRSRLWGLFAATARNDSLRLPAPYPANAALLKKLGSDQLPDGILMKELLRVWGQQYNSSHPPGSQGHLQAIQVDQYQWDGRGYADYHQFVKSWREEL